MTREIMKKYQLSVTAVRSNTSSLACHTPGAPDTHVTSLQVLLSLSDSDIQTGFGMSNPLHKRKLRLALDDIRAPDNVTYPQLAKIDHLWVVEEWLPSIGLNQYKVIIAGEFLKHVLENTTG